MSQINSSFTDFPLIKLPPETDFVLRRTPQVAPGHNTGYYSYAHIARIKEITREHCIHVTDHSGWRFSTPLVMKDLHCDYCMYVQYNMCGFRINVNLVKEGSFLINVKLVKEEFNLS